MNILQGMKYKIILKRKRKMSSFALVSKLKTKIKYSFLCTNILYSGGYTFMQLIY